MTRHLCHSGQRQVYEKQVFSSEWLNRYSSYKSQHCKHGSSLCFCAHRTPSQGCVQSLSSSKDVWIILLPHYLSNDCCILNCFSKYAFSSCSATDHVEHLGSPCELAIVIPCSCSSVQSLQLHLQAALLLVTFKLEGDPLDFRCH